MMLKSHPDCQVCNRRRDKQAVKRARWMDHGLCSRCGGTLVGAGVLKVCWECRVKDAAAKRHKRAMKKKVAA